MRHLILFSLLCLAAAPSFVRSADVYLANTSGTITVAPDGSVAEVQIAESFGEGIDEPLRKRIKAWRFEPVMLEGRPITAIAHMDLTLRADIADTIVEGIRIIRADFVDSPELRQADARRRSVKPPSYPKSALRHGFGAQLMLVVEVDEVGRVKNSAALSGWLTGPKARARQQEQVMRSFVNASQRAVMTWQLPVPTASDSNVYRIPISFRIDDATWSPAYWIEQAPAAWMVTGDSSKIAALDAAGNFPRSDIRLLTELDIGS